MMQINIVDILSGVIKVLGESKDSAQALFAFVSTMVAVVGLSTWKKQIIGKTEHELAIRLLRAIYTLRDSVDSFRYPCMSSGEMYAAAMKRIGDENEVKQLFSRYDTSHKLTEIAYQVRWERIKEAVSDLDVQKIEAEALWGNKITDSLEPCYQHIDKLKYSFNYYKLDISKRDNDKFAKSEKIVMNFQPLDDKKDEFGDSFAVAIKNASEVYRSYLHIK